MGLIATVKRKGDRSLGLLVKDQFARRFLLPEEDRKVYEIRSRPINFIKAGERIALISCNNSRSMSCSRSLLGVLEFVGNVKIKATQFEKYYQLHRVNESEFSVDGHNYVDENGFVHAWHFELVGAFQLPLHLSAVETTSTVVWHYFSVENVNKVQLGAIIVDIYILYKQCI